MIGGKRRTSTEIMEDVLTACSDETLKTHIMYEANLSYSALEDYLSELQDRGFIDHEEDGSFRITEDGNKLLEQLQRTHSILD